MADANVKTIAAEEKEPFFGKKERKLLSDPLNDNNPITVQVLGICSALAVTTMVKPALIMAVSVTFVTAFSNLAISALRKGIPKQIRMIVQLVVIAFLVTVVEQTLKAFNYATWKQYQLYRDGAPGSVCNGEFPLALFSGRYREWPGLWRHFDRRCCHPGVFRAG